MIILDTNVVAVLMGTSLNEGTASWLAAQDPSALRITSITRAEIRYGIARLPEGKRREMYQQAANRLFTSQQDRTLSFDSAAADAYGVLVAERARRGRPIGIADAQIAAIALVLGATVATRDGGGFEHTGVAVVDPFG